jgi:hypothetical protein
MESYLENFGDVKGKNSSDEALRRWRKLCSVVKNPKRRFRFTANLDKRGEAQAIKHANHVRASLFPHSPFFCYLLLPAARSSSGRDLRSGARLGLLRCAELVRCYAGG